MNNNNGTENDTETPKLDLRGWNLESDAMLDTGINFLLISNIRQEKL
jgi:hypothetical protein